MEINSDRKADERSESGKSAASRRLAEWVSLGISALLIASTVTYLIVQGLRGQSEFVPLAIDIVDDGISQVADQYIVPIEVHNRGQQTIRSFTGEIRLGGAEGESHEFTIDYLGVRATEKVYVYLHRDPRSEDVRVTALTYQVD